MNTLPTHLVINAAIEKKYGAKANIVKSAFLWGSVMPDIPLALLSLGYFLFNRYVAAQPASGMMDSAFDNLYFNNPFWIASHNFFTLADCSCYLRHSSLALFESTQLARTLVAVVCVRLHATFGC